MIDTKILADKLKYIVITELGKEFEISHFDLDIHWVNYETESEIEEYDVDMKFDYQGVIDASIHDFYHDIIKMSDKIQTVLSNVTITRLGKLVSGKDEVFVSDGMLWDINFQYDQKHEFNMSFKVNYRD